MLARIIEPTSKIDADQLFYCRQRGLSAEEIQKGLETFKGIKRRMEVRGVAGGVTVYDDFAHHPTAIAETLAGLRAANPHRRIWAVFEPRSASSSRKVFQRDFARAFGPADEVIIAPVFRTNLDESERLSPQQLVGDLTAAGQHARYAASLDDIVTVIRFSQILTGPVAPSFLGEDF